MYQDLFVTSPMTLRSGISIVLNHSLTTAVATDSDIEPRRIGTAIDSSRSNVLSALMSLQHTTMYLYSLQ